MTQYNVAWCLKVDAETPKEAIVKYMKLLFEGNDDELDAAVGEHLKISVAKNDLPNTHQINSKIVESYFDNFISFDELVENIVLAPLPELPALEDIELYPLL